MSQNKIVVPLQRMTLDGEVEVVKAMTVYPEGIQAGPTWRHALYANIQFPTDDNYPQSGITGRDLFLMAYVRFVQEGVSPEILTTFDQLATLLDQQEVGVNGVDKLIDKMHYLKGVL